MAGGGPRNLMAYEKALKWQIINGSLARRLIFRGFVFSIAIAALPLMQLVCDFDALKPDPNGFDECSSDLAYLLSNSLVGRVLSPVTPNSFSQLSYSRCKEDVNLTVHAVRELMDLNLMNFGSGGLCIGRNSGSAVLALRELGFANVDGVYRRNFFARKEKEAVHELNHKDNSFDFLIVGDLSKNSIPALIVSEIERVLKPGGIGAVILRIDSSRSSTLIRSAMPVSLFLKNSTVVHVARLNAENTLVTFKKKFDHINSLVEHRLPADCPSLRRNKPYINQIEPLIQQKPRDRHSRRIAYLPEFIGMTSNMQLIYIDMGKREKANFSHSNWFLPSYPIDSKAFSVYIVDHNALVMSSHVQKPGVNFIYHPGLSSDLALNSDYLTGEEDPDQIPMDEDEFDFLTWFKETVMYSDLVVLKMNAGRAQLKFLSDLFESGAICSVDELFLECSDSDLEVGIGEVKLGENCMDLFRNLRSNGVFVHQWWSK